MEHIQAKKGNHKDESCSHQNNVPIPNLIKKNTTTQTYEVLICSLFLFTVFYLQFMWLTYCVLQMMSVFFTLYLILVASFCFLYMFYMI